MVRSTMMTRYADRLAQCHLCNKGLGRLASPYIARWAPSLLDIQRSKGVPIKVYRGVGQQAGVTRSGVF